MCGARFWQLGTLERLPAGNSDRSDPNCLDSDCVILRILKTIVKQIFQKIPRKPRGEPLAAIDQSRNGSTGSAKMAQFMAAANSIATFGTIPMIDPPPIASQGPTGASGEDDRTRFGG